MMSSPDKILVIDDDKLIQDLIRACLEPQGYQLAFATRGLEALELLETGQFQVAILDIMLPEINGIEILRRIQGRLLHTEIIMLTGHASLETAIEALRLGAYDYTTKPFSLQSLRSTVKRALEKQYLESGLTAIYDLSREMALSLKVGQVALAMLDIVERVLEFKICELWMVDEEQNEIYLLTAYGVETASSPRLPLNSEKEVIAIAAKSGELLYIPDTTQDPRYISIEIESLSELAIPLKVRERVIGVLNVESADRDAFSSNDARLLSTLAAQAAVAIENARLYEQAKQEIVDRKRAEAALRESEARYRALFEQANDAIFLENEHEKILDVNRRACQLFGYSRQELLKMSTRDLEEETMRLERRSAPSLSNMAGETTFETTGVRRDGTHLAVEISLGEVTDSGEKLMLSIARDISERKQAEQEIKQRNRELAALYEIGQAITSSLNLQETLTLIASHITHLLNVDGASLLLRDHAGDDFWFAAGSGGGTDMILGKRLEAGQGIAGWVAQHGEPLLVPDVSQDPRWFGEFDQEGAFTTHSILCVPLQSKGQTIGALEAINKRVGTFDQDDIWLLSSLAAPAATAIENAQLFEQVQAGRQQLQALSRRLVEIQETERGRISRELHDETGQALSSILLGLSLLEREAHDSEAVVSRAVELEQVVDEVLENLHRMAMNLRPASLDHLGLIAALKYFIEVFNRQYGLTVPFEVVGFGEKRLPPTIETTLYRIVQEALTNVARHAQATHVDIILERRKDSILTIIEDNGIGFDAKAAMESGRLGLVGMRERVEMLDGTLTIESSAGTGTTVLVEVPYAHHNIDR